VTTPHDAERIRQVRRLSRHLVTIGACATAGGVQALKNFGDVNEFVSIVYASPDYISTLETSTPISAHVPVDFELHGCPIDKRQLLEVITAFLHGRRPNIPSTSVCMECKRRGTVCVMVAHGTPCLGPVTHAGCGALCPSYDRGCYGCFGPMETPNTVSLTRQLKVLGMREPAVERVFRTFNVTAFDDARQP
jgi:coenzyme F420-reducing hydrogenase gamma subunit